MSDTIVELVTRADMDDVIAGLLAKYPLFPTIRAEACCPGHAQDDAVEEYGCLARMAYGAYEDAVFLLGVPKP